MTTWQDIINKPGWSDLDLATKAEVRRQWLEEDVAPALANDPDRDAVLAELYNEPLDTGEGLIRSALGSAARGFFDPLAAAPEVAGAYLGIEGIEEFGGDVRGAIEGAFPVNPAEQGLVTDVAGVLGQVGQIVATGGGGSFVGGKLIGKGATELAKKQAEKFGARAAVQTAMGSSAVAGGLERAEQLGLEGGDRLLRGAIAGGTELLAERLGGFATELGGVGKALGFGSDTIESGFMQPIIRGMVTEIPEEMGVETAGQLTDIAMAPETAPAFDFGQTAYAGLLGAVGGVAFGGIEAAITPRTKKAFEFTEDFTPSTTPPPGMTRQEADDQDLLVYDNIGNVIGYKTPQVPVTAETIEAELPVEIAPAVAPLVETVANTPEASATAAALQRSAEELRAAEANLEQAEDEGILMDVFADERAKAVQREDAEAAALREAGMRMLTGQQIPTETITAQAETVTPAPVAEKIITEQENQAALEQQQQIETPISEQPANVAPRASNSVQPRPERVGRNTDARDAWDEQFGSLRRGGRTHNDDGTPYQPTVFDEVMGQVTEGLKGNSIDENIDAIGVDAGIESGTAVKQLLNDGWVWDEQVKRMVDTKNRGESPAAALRRIRSKKGQQQQPTETNVPITQETLQQEQSRGQELQEPRELPILPAEQAAQAPEAAVGAETAVDTQAALDTQGDGIVRDEGIVGADAELEQQKATLPVDGGGAMLQGGDVRQEETQQVSAAADVPTESLPATGQLTPRGVGVARDATKPEQMTPGEFNAARKALTDKIAKAEANLADARAVQPSKNPAVQIKRVAKIGARRQELADAEKAFEDFYPTMAFAVEDAVKNRQPFSVAAHQESGMPYIPQGYTLNEAGDLYVFNATPPPQAQPQPATPATQETKPQAAAPPTVTATQESTAAQPAEAVVELTELPSYFQRNPQQKKLWDVDESYAEPARISQSVGDKIGPRGTAFTVEQLMYQIAALREFVSNMNGRLLRGGDKGASTKELAEKWTTLRGFEALAAEYAAENPQEWQSYRNRQNELLGLESGADVIVPYPSPDTAPLGNIGKLDKKFSKNWRVIYPNGETALFHPTALRAVSSTAETVESDVIEEVTPLTQAQAAIVDKLPELEARDAQRRGLGFDYPRARIGRLPGDQNAYISRPDQKNVGVLSPDGSIKMLSPEESASIQGEINAFEKRQAAQIDKRMATLREEAKKQSESKLYQLTPSDPVVRRLDGKWINNNTGKPLGRSKNDQRLLSQLENNPNIESYQVVAQSTDGGVSFIPVSRAAQPAAGETGDAGVAISPTGETVQSSEAPSALESLTATQRKIVMREGVSESDAAAYEAEQKRQFALRNPPAATDSQFLEDYNAYVNSLSDETLQQERESREEAPGVDDARYSKQQGDDKVVELEFSELPQEFDIPGDPVALAELRELARDASSKIGKSIGVFDLANILENMVKYGTAERFGIQAKDAERARQLNDSARGKTEGPPDDDGFFYHVTTKRNAKAILKSGAIQPGKQAQFQTAATQANSQGRVFVSNLSGVSFWKDRIQEQLDDRESREKLVVLRIPKSLVVDPQIDNALETRSDSFYTTSQIPTTSGTQTRYKKILRSADGSIRRTGVKSTPARAARNSYIGVIPGVENTWLGTVEEFDAEFPDGYPFDSKNNTPPADTEALVAEDGRAFIFIDRVQVLDGDAERAEQHGTSPGVEAIKRLLRHESFVHRGYMALPGPLKNRFADFVASGIIPPEDLDYLVNNGYPQYKGWRDSKATEMLAAEEWLAQRVERMGRIPQSGPIASIMDWLRDVWRWLTGGETTDLDKLRNTMRAMHKALGALDPKQRIVMELPDMDALRRSVAGGGITPEIQDLRDKLELLELEFRDIANRLGGNSDEASEAFDRYSSTRNELRNAEIQARHPGTRRLTLAARDEALGPLQALAGGRDDTGYAVGRRNWKRGKKERSHPDLGDVFAAEGSGALFRSVSLEDYARIKKSGFIDTDFRGAISKAEGINLTPDTATAANYIPSGGTGVILAIDTKGLDLKFISADDYIRSFEPIPATAIVAVSDPITIDAESGAYMLHDGAVRYSKVQRPDPILNQPSRLRGNVPEMTKPNAQRRAIYETVEGFEGAVEVIPRQYFPMGSKEKGNEFSATDALLSWSKDLLKPYAEDIGGLVEFLAILRSDERLQSELKLGPRSGAVVMPFLAQEAANRAEALGSRDMRNAFLMEYDALASAGGQNLWAFKAASLHPDFATNRYTAMMDKTEEQNFAATVDKKINKSRTIQDVVSNLPEAGEVAADNVSDGLTEEKQISDKVLELGASVQGNPKLSERIRQVISDVLKRGFLLRAMEKLKGEARKSIIPESNIYDGLTLEEMEAELARLDKGIADSIEFIENEVAKKPTEKPTKGPKTPIETAKEIINKITTAAAKVPAKKKQPDVVRSLYRKHLKKPMSEAEFSAEAKTAGLDAATTKGLYDAINLEIVAIEIQAQARAAERAQTKELKKAEREAEKYQNQAEAKINEVADALADPSLTQDKEKVVNPLTEIYQNQIKTPITEPQFVEQVVALGVDEETATLLFSIAAMDRQARIDIRVAREDLRRREMSEAQASKLIYAQEEELRQGSKDREPSKSGDSINKAFREQVVNPLSQEKFRERLDKLKVSQKLADRLYATAERVATDNERAEVYRKRVALLDVDSAALTRFVNDLRLKGKLTGEPIQWRDLLSLPVAHQDTVKAELLARVKRHEALRNLSTGEQQAIADALNTIWQRERRKVFQAMIKKADLMGVSKEDQEVIVDAMPALLKYINQGMLGTSAFYRAVGEKFGIAPISAEARKQVEEMAAKMQEKELYSFERAVLAEKILKILQNNTQLSRAEILSSWWVNSVLTGGRTIFDMALGVLSGGFSIAKKMITATIETRSPKAAIDGLSAFGDGLWAGAQVAFKNLFRPEEGLLASRNPAIADYFDKGAIGAGLTTGDKLLIQKGDRPKDKLKRGLGVWMSFFERLFAGLDHITSTATMHGTMRMAAAMNPKMFSDALIPTKQDYANAMERAKLRLPGASKAAQIRLSQSIIEDGQHILERGLDESFMSQWRQLVADSRAEGNTASYQEEPTGAGGLIYGLVRKATSGLEDKTKGYRDEARVSLTEAMKARRGVASSTVNYFVASLGYFLGTQAQNLLGVRFMRFTGNKLNELISFIPIVGMARLQEKGMVSGENYTLRGQNVRANQVLGWMSAAIYLMLLNDLDEEDEERGWIVNGSWDNLTPERKSQQMAVGLKPNTYSKFNKETGRWTSYNFVSWPFAGWMAAFGSVSDYKRLTPEKWNEKVLADKMMAAAYAGAFALKDISSLSSLTEMFGTSSDTTDPAEAAQKRFVKGASNFAGGFIPKTFKDVDAWFDETNYKPQDTFEHFAKEVPFYRRSIGEPLRDIFYEKVQVSRTPWSRAIQISPDDPAYRILGRLNSNGIWITPANPSNRKVKRGGKLRDMTDEESNAYMAEVGKRYKEFVMKQGDRLLEMDVDRAEELVSKYTARIREIAFKRAIATAGKAAIPSPE